MTKSFRDRLDRLEAARAAQGAGAPELLFILWGRSPVGLRALLATAVPPDVPADRVFGGVWPFPDPIPAARLTYPAGLSDREVEAMLVALRKDRGDAETRASARLYDASDDALMEMVLPAFRLVGVAA